MKKKTNIEDLYEKQIAELLGKFIMSLPPGVLGDLSDIEKMYEEVWKFRLMRECF